MVSNIAAVHRAEYHLGLYPAEMHYSWTDTLQNSDLKIFIHDICQ